jgi:hypothetical protein
MPCGYSAGSIQSGSKKLLTDKLIIVDGIVDCPLTAQRASANTQPLGLVLSAKSCFTHLIVEEFQT